MVCWHGVWGRGLTAPFLPPKIRGRVDIGIDGTWHLGGAIAAILNIALGEIS